MEGRNLRREKPSPSRAWFVSLVVLLCLPAQAKVVDLDTSFEQPVSTNIGGRTLLVEEITATWCPSCAEIDPQLTQVADSHGSRIAMVALHPSDGEDAFQPPASQHRIERHRIANEALNNYSTPTFVVEGGEPRVGYDAWQDVQKDILNTELARQDVSELAFSVVRTNNGYRATVSHLDLNSYNDTQLTFLVLEHKKPMPPDAFNPGESTRDRVLVATAECNLESNNVTTSIGLVSTSLNGSCQDSFTVEFASLESWSVLLVHEPVNDSIVPGARLMTFGAVELAFRERATLEATSVLGPWLLGSAVVLALVSISRKK
jgi:thiol-disulfide isomerase/thioredoxin